MGIAVVAFGDAAQGDDAIGIEVISKMEKLGIRADAISVGDRTNVLRVLEEATKFDGLVIIDAASMGQPPGSFTVVTINDLIMKHRMASIKLHGMRIDSDLVYAHKFLDLPPTRLVLIQPETLTGGRVSKTLLSRMADYLDAVTQAVEQLERCV